MSDESLETGLEEEKGGPAGGVADEVRGQAAVEGGEGLVGLRQTPEDGDGGERCRGVGWAASVDCFYD